MPVHHEFPDEVWYQVHNPDAKDEINVFLRRELDDQRVLAARHPHTGHYSVWIDDRMIGGPVFLVIDGLRESDVRSTRFIQSMLRSKNDRDAYIRESIESHKKAKRDRAAKQKDEVGAAAETVGAVMTSPKIKPRIFSYPGAKSGLILPKGM